MSQTIGLTCVRNLRINNHAGQIRRANRVRSFVKPAVQRSSHVVSGRHSSLQVYATATTSLSEAQQYPKGSAFPGTPGVYAIYDEQGTLQYVGLTRKINLSVANHKEAVPELVHSVKFIEVPGGDKESLTEMWKTWVSEAVQDNGDVPPGNKKGETKWQAGPRRAKPEIRLTPGKGLDDLTCSLEELIDAVVKSNKVVAFVKGTRTQPSCGFSYKVLTILNEIGADYEVVNVLDEVYNPGVREAIKTYSQWPTIPQIYVGGEFVGGADIVEEMHGSGELRKVITGQA